MSGVFVAVVAGCDPNLPEMQSAVGAVKQLGVSYEVNMTFVHRMAEDTCS